MGPGRGKSQHHDALSSSRRAETSTHLWHVPNSALHEPAGGGGGVGGVALPCDSPLQGPVIPSPVGKRQQQQQLDEEGPHALRNALPSGACECHQAYYQFRVRV